MNQTLGDAGQCAYGGIGISHITDASDASDTNDANNGSDALQITCAVPLDAIKGANADKMLSSLYLNTREPITKLVSGDRLQAFIVIAP